MPGDAENEEPLENEEQPEDVVVPPFNLNGTVYNGLLSQLFLTGCCYMDARVF